MSKIKLVLATLSGAVGILLIALTTSVLAGGWGIGVTGNQAYFSTTGTETLKTNSTKTTGTVDNDVMVPSVYMEYTGDAGWVIGLDYVPGNATLGAKTTTRTDKLTDGTGSTVTQKAEADVSDHWTVYAETPAWTALGLYLKAGYTEVTVETNENLGTGAAYGNADVSASVVGLGMKRSFGNNALIKLEGTYTDYDSISLSSTGSDVATTIVAEPEAYAVRLSLGYSF